MADRFDGSMLDSHPPFPVCRCVKVGQQIRWENLECTYLTYAPLPPLLSRQILPILWHAY